MRILTLRLLLGGIFYARIANKIGFCYHIHMDLAVQNRTSFGRSVKTLRKEGLIPAEFYGRGLPNAHVVIKQDEFKKIFKAAGENTVITLLVDGKKQPALIYDVQHNSVSGDVVHVDFYGVRMDEKIKAGIPLEFVGESPAVKEKQGILNKTISEIEVEALPADLPHSFKVDLSKLVDIDQSIYVKDLGIPKNVSVELDPETVVVTVTPPKKEEEIVAPVEATDLSAVKVETEEKKAERATERAENEKNTAAA